MPFKNEKKYKKKIENYIFSKKIKIGDKKILLFNNKNENKEIILLYLKNIKIYNNKKIINQWNRKLYEIKNFYKKKVIQSNNDIIKLSKILNKKIKILNKNKNLKCNDELTAISFGIPIKKLSNPIKYKNNFIILKINKRYNKNIKNINKINKKIKLYFSKKEFLNFLIKKNIKNIIFFKN
ncbi:hypothetical protein [Candidatus Shikimatogenerans silvanidophilus]|uniref:hypothetical protein n=1 Tax=Candidatus Shikimatogenerans silvanidophilus TaxID=2782547 RepID=UPI001BA8AAF6|nr:hypothetical protein [Candidatus Shikimatogenerans silvanidophilus]